MILGSSDSTTAPRRCRRAAVWLVAVAGLVGQLSCKPNPAAQQPPGSDVARQTTTHDTTPADEGVGQLCQSVADCPSYLWCVEQACQLPAAVTNTHDSTTPRATFRAARDPSADPADATEAIASFYLELAVSAAEHEKGLMFRRQLPDDWAMLFVYPDEAARSFWMQNTFIALDMVFIDSDGRVVNIVRQAAPLTRVRRESDGPARYVLEIAGGRADQLGLHAGQHVEFSHVDGQ